MEFNQASKQPSAMNIERILVPINDIDIEYHTPMITEQFNFIKHRRPDAIKVLEITF